MDTRDWRKESLDERDFYIPPKNLPFNRSTHPKAASFSANFWICVGIWLLILAVWGAVILA